ncbi:manganese efflux pump MntP [Alicyclobacillus fastidiosus]|uniref:Manganese efflux pump n=1 Tax=Alicyclobacillus fastidiosus TaxID=392011 RepID=A0ABV5ACD0_9BACL|nr:manganese efflux pump [Alicyclobacillus fastidiosus]WEH11378.1 manganese efflux pump [Alicyclobacillus fastidiosus]
MGWLSAFMIANLIGIGSNFDNCSTGIAYGSHKLKFPHWVNAVVNAIGFSTSLLGAYMGTFISRYLTPESAAWAACVALICIGLFFWYAAYIHPVVSKRGRQINIKRPGCKEGVILGFALSATNVVSGFGATVSHSATVWVTAITISIWGYIMIWVGNVIGIGILSKFLGSYSSLISGLILILVGLHQVLI